ncbi:MAG: hypothetical protein K0M63_07550 [Weeksellaceae bacterium]|nr:hypothetical protein [Weeksellaceae bacterium]
MFKKLIQTSFICLTIGVFAQEKDLLGVPSPMAFENAQKEVVNFEMTKSILEPKTRVIVQEYAPKSKSTERITITFQPESDPRETLKKKHEEIMENKRAKEVEATEIGEHKFLIKYRLINDKNAAERREVFVGMGKTETGTGTYIIEYSGGNFTQMLNLEKLPEMNITAVY